MEGVTGVNSIPESNRPESRIKRFGPIGLAGLKLRRIHYQPPAYYRDRDKPGTASEEDSLLGNNRQLNSHFNIRVQVKLDFILACCPQWAFWQANFALLNVSTRSSDYVSNITHTDGAKQLAFIACFGGYCEGCTFQGLSAGLSCC